MRVFSYLGVVTYGYYVTKMSTTLSDLQRELLPIEVLHCGNRDFELWPWPWPWPWRDGLYIRI